MSDFAPRLEAVDTTTAPDSTLRAIANHTETLRAVRLPEDPPLNEAALLADLRRRDTEADTRRFVLWDGEAVVASAAVRLPLADNTHLAFLDLGVQAPYRRRGLATRLLAEVAACAAQNGRRLLMTNANSRQPSGEAVLRRLDAKMVMEQQFIQLNLSELEPDLLTRLMREAGAPDYHLWQVQGALPCCFSGPPPFAPNTAVTRWAAGSKPQTSTPRRAPTRKRGSSAPGTLPTTPECWRSIMLSAFVPT